MVAGGCGSSFGDCNYHARWGNSIGAGAGGGAGGPSIAVLHGGSGTLTVNTSLLGVPAAIASGGAGGAGGIATTSRTLPPAEPVHTPVTMSCFTSAMGQASYDTNNTGATVFAPRSVKAGRDFTVEITPDPVNVPTKGGGYNLGSLTNLKVSMAVPAGATYVGATLTGGSNLGSGTPSVSQSGGKVTLAVPGPLTPGTTAILPKLDITFMATGGPGTLIESKFAGTSYSNPGLSFTVAVDGQADRHGHDDVELLRPGQPDPRHHRGLLSHLPLRHEPSRVVVPPEEVRSRVRPHRQPVSDVAGEPLSCRRCRVDVAESTNGVGVTPR